jgi:hypothetical protein
MENKVRLRTSERLPLLLLRQWKSTARRQESPEKRREAPAFRRGEESRVALKAQGMLY